jgi:hypothetical protein
MVSAVVSGVSGSQTVSVGVQLPTTDGFGTGYQDLRAVARAADAGMLSASNLSALDEAGLGFIVGSRSVKAPIDLASHFHWNGDVFTDGQIIDTVTPRHANSTVNDVAHRAEPVWNPDDHGQAWRAIWSYSAKRARRDQKTL